MSAALPHDLDRRVADLQRRVRVALEKAPADLLLRGGQVVSVHAEEIYPADVAICGGRIVAVRERFEGAAVETLDCSGLRVLPGLIEPFAPRDRALEAFAKDAVPNGTTFPVTGDDAAFAPPLDGVATDGMCPSFEELIARLRVGLTVFLSARPGEAFDRLLKDVAERKTDVRHLCLSGSDGRLNDAVARAIRQGIPPVRAIQMATFNTSLYFGLEDELGSVAPGRRANLLLVRDLGRMEPAIVIVGGAVVARDGRRLPVASLPWTTS